MHSRRGVCLVIAAASGAGKSSVSRALLAAEPELSLSVSATTRAPRPGERDGVHYHFRDAAGFRAMVEAGEMLEHAEVFGRRYGTPRAPVEAALAAGRDVLFDIDWQGHLQLRARLPNDVESVFLLPPGMGELERRLRARGQDSEAEIARRMASARRRDRALDRLRARAGEPRLRRNGGGGTGDPGRGAVAAGAAALAGRLRVGAAARLTAG